jgi:predicted DNA-binding antitoxin AbrB/MazE fold protein
MTTTITAIYEQGVLRPLTPLAVPEHARVLIQVQGVSTLEEAVAHHRRVRAALVAAGLSLPTPEPLPVINPLSAERREELARLFSVGRPLSELIIEEREAR